MSASSPNLICPAVPELSAAPVESLLPAPRSGRAWWWIAGILAIAILLIAPLVYGGVEAALAGERAQTTLRRAYVEIQAGHFAAAREQLVQTRQHFTEARLGLQHVGAWRAVPLIGVHLQGLDQALQAGSVALEGAEQLVEAVDSVNAAFQAVSVVQGELRPGIDPRRSFRDLSREDKRVILDRVNQALPRLRVAREKTLIALDAWEQIPTQELLAPVQRAMAPVTQALEQFRVRSTEVMSLAEVLLPMIGYPEPKTFVILLQNADELRPTGGFIGTVGLVRVDAGELVSVNFKDVYAYDREASTTTLGVPPAPLQRELGVGAWYLRDSNWSPDFPQTAGRIQTLFEQMGWSATSGTASASVDGVIALQPGLFRQLLRALGPVSVDGVDYAADNFFDKLQYAVERGFIKAGIPAEQRKDVVEKIGSALLDRLIQQPASRWAELLEIGFKALTQKEALFFVSDPALQAVFDARGWSGRIRSAAQDELWVVDANLAALKTDGVMDKNIRYAVDFTDPAGPKATVTLTYQNTNRTIDWRYTRYRDYVRVYVPEGSELLSSEGAMLSDRYKTGGRAVSGPVDVMHDLGKTVLGAFWSIEPGETRELKFTYRLPKRVMVTSDSQQMYQLLIQKQPGARQRLTLDLNFGKKLMSAAPPEAPSQFGDTRYRLTLPVVQDQAFTVTWPL